MRAPPLTPAQQHEDQRLYALANGSPDVPEAPRNRRELRALVTEILRGSFTFRDWPPRPVEPQPARLRGSR